MRFLFFFLPWLELFTLIALGVENGLLTVFAVVIGTFFAGVWILRSQGRGMLQRMQRAQSTGGFGAHFLLDDLATGFAGLLLMVPGLITDCVALLVLIGPLRRKLAAWLRPGGESVDGPHQASHRTGYEPRHGEVIEGSYERVDPS